MIALKLLLSQKVSKGMGPQWQWARCKQNRFCCRFYNFFLNTTQWICVYRLSNNTATSNKISFANSGGKALWAQSWKYQSKLYRKDWAANNFEQIYYMQVDIWVFDEFSGSFFPLRVTIFSDSKWSQLTCLALASDVIWLNFSLSGILHDRNVSNKFLASSKIACRKICLVDHRNRHYIRPGA